MKKNLIIFGIFFLLICVGLSGCLYNDSQGERGITIDEIKTHPNRYINTIVNLTAKYYGTIEYGEWEHIMDNEYNTLKVKFLDSVNTSILIKDGEYYYTGVIRLWDDIQFYYETEFVYLEVSSIQPT